MRILLDHCVPKPFGRAFPAHDVKTTSQMGWEQLQNGKLLAQAAAASFEVFLTVDKNIRHQQNLQTLPLAIIVLNVSMNTPQALLPFAPLVERALTVLVPRQVIEIDAAGTVTLVTA